MRKEVWQKHFRLQGKSRESSSRPLGSPQTGAIVTGQRSPMSPRNGPALLPLPHIVVGWEWLLEARPWSKAWVDFRGPGQGPQSVMPPVVDGLRGHDGGGRYGAGDCPCLGTLLASHTRGPGLASTLRSCTLSGHRRPGDGWMLGLVESGLSDEAKDDTPSISLLCHPWVGFLWGW